MTACNDPCGDGSSRYRLKISKEEVFFGAIVVGNASSAVEILLENKGWEDILLQSFSISGPFTLVRTNCPDLLNPGKKGTITVVFTPTTFGPWTGVLQIRGGRAGDHNIRLFGAGYTSNENGNDLAGIPIFMTREDLEEEANLVYPNGSYALVVSDEILANNDFYRKSGNSGEGQWSQPVGRLSNIILNGQIDLENLNKVINGSATLANPGHPNGTVTFRNGQTYKTLANILNNQTIQEETATASAVVAATNAAIATSGALRAEMALTAVTSLYPGVFFDDVAAALSPGSPVESGQWFITWEGERARIYERNGNQAVEKFELLTVANFAGPGGDASISISELSSIVAANTARISAEEVTRANAISAEASSRTALAAAIRSEFNQADATLSSAITNEQVARANGDTTEATARTTLAATLRTETDTKISAAVTTVQNARIAGDEAEASARTTLAVTLRGETDTKISAAVSSVNAARIAGDQAEASARNTLGVSLGSSISAQVSAEASARASADEAISNTMSLIGAKTNDGSAFILNSDTVRVNNSTTLASRLSNLDSVVGANTAAISTEATTRASAISALASTLSGVQSSVGANTAAISNEATTRASAIGALATTVSGLQTTVGSNTSAISTIQTVQAGYDGVLSSLQAGYSLTLNVNGYISGFKANNTGVTSDFTVQADRFRIVGSGASPEIPFEIVGGVTRIANAVIGVANVQTGNIAPNATYESASAFSGSTVNCSATANELIVAQQLVVAVAAGNVVALTAGCDASCDITSHASPFATVFVELWRDTTRLYFGLGDYIQDYTKSARWAISIDDIPGAGTFTYQLRVQAFGAGNVLVGNRSIRAPRHKV
jgi:biotin carboxyl carrier protein